MAEEGRPGIVLERIDGVAMSEHMKTDPGMIPELIEQLLDLQTEVQRTAVLGLGWLDERLHTKIGEATQLPSAERAEARRLLELLPAGDALCHGDFHPANIIISSRGLVILDWFDAARGDTTADFVRSSTRAACANAGDEGRVLAVAADVTDPASVEACFDTAVERFGPPDLVFNNAGVQGELLPLQDYPVEDFPFVMNVNVFGIFNVLREAARGLRAAGMPGAIVNSASMAGVEGAANMPAYSASKGAVMSLTRSASKDCAPLGIRVNAISPAFVGEGLMWNRQVERQALADTQYYSTDPEIVAQEMIEAVPLRRTGTLDEVAATVLWLLSDESSYISGHNIIISGGI